MQTAHSRGRGATPILTASTPPPDPARTRRRAEWTFLAALTLAALAWSVSGTDMTLVAFRHALPNLGEFLHRMWPPDLTWNTTDARPFSPPLHLAATAVAVTLQISLLGTALGAAGALAFGLLAAENLTPHWVHHPVKVMLALVRSLPVILLALLFVAAIGLGPLPGVLAVAVHSFGMLGKLYAEEFESADPGVWEALSGAGANWPQCVRYALWPQCARQVASHTLFRFEMNLRESAVLGLVGVAGLGLWIENYRRAFDYRSVATLVLVTMMLVLAVDQFVFHVRRRLK
jgi:phosphonate transport system permease protein